MKKTSPVDTPAQDSAGSCRQTEAKLAEKARAAG